MIQKLYFPTLKKCKIHAFTLVEIMFAIVIIGIIGIALTSLMTDSARNMLWSVNKSLITKDFREFTLGISQDAINANSAYLYPSFAPADCDDAGDRRASGLTGDCLVLVSTVPLPTINSQRFYSSIVIYNRESGASEDDERPVFRREITFLPNPNISTEIPLETVLADQRNNFGNAEMVLQLSRGLNQNNLFFRISPITLMINGEIIHGENAQRTTNTYNLAISTRG